MIEALMEWEGGHRARTPGAGRETIVLTGPTETIYRLQHDHLQPQRADAQIRIGRIHLGGPGFDERGQDDRIGHGEAVAVRDAGRAPQDRGPGQPHQTTDVRQILHESLGRRLLDGAPQPQLFQLVERKATDRGTQLPAQDPGPDSLRSRVRLQQPDEEACVQTNGHTPLRSDASRSRSSTSSASGATRAVPISAPILWIARSRRRSSRYCSTARANSAETDSPSSRAISSASRPIGSGMLTVTRIHPPHRCCAYNSSSTMTHNQDAHASTRELTKPPQ